MLAYPSNKMPGNRAKWHTIAEFLFLKYYAQSTALSHKVMDYTFIHFAGFPD